MEMRHAIVLRINFLEMWSFFISNGDNLHVFLYPFMTESDLELVTWTQMWKHENDSNDPLLATNRRDFAYILDQCSENMEMNQKIKTKWTGMSNSAAKLSAGYWNTAKASKKNAQRCWVLARIQMIFFLGIQFVHSKQIAY